MQQTLKTVSHQLNDNAGKGAVLLYMAL